MDGAAIRAGGRSSRFGGPDRSALGVDGRTILDRQIAELSRITPDTLVVGDRRVLERFGDGRRLLANVNTPADYRNEASP
jgi:molybdopterin-guanine dinucleotide biosynthesis protein A